MRLSLFSITAILASFVAANPILAPRASNPFSLYGHFGSRTSDLLLGIRSVREPGHLGYYQLGFFGQTSDPIEFVFTKDANHPGPVLDALLNGFEMVMQAITNADTGSTYYRALLVDRSSTALNGLQSPDQFYIKYGSFYFSPDGSENGDDRDGMKWFTCITSATRVETDREYVEDLYFSFSLPRGCDIGRQPSLGASYRPAAPVQFSADVTA